MARGRGVPVGLGGDGRAEELRNVEKKLTWGLVGARMSGGGVSTGADGGNGACGALSNGEEGARLWNRQNGE